MTDDELRAIEARAEAATPGPWECKWVRDGDSQWVVGPRGQYVVNTDRARQYNLDFLAHARTDIPALCKALREASAELAEAKDVIAAYRRADRFAFLRDAALAKLAGEGEK